MAANLKTRSSQKNRGSAGKSAKNPKAARDNDYPNIIEEPTRVVGDQTRRKSKAGKSRKQSAKRSGKTRAKKLGKKKRS